MQLPRPKVPSLPRSEVKDNAPQLIVGGPDFKDLPMPKVASKVPPKLPPSSETIVDDEQDPGLRLLAVDGFELLMSQEVVNKCSVLLEVQKAKQEAKDTSSFQTKFTWRDLLNFVRCITMQRQKSLFDYDLEAMADYFGLDGFREMLIERRDKEITDRLKEYFTVDVYSSGLDLLNMAQQRVSVDVDDVYGPKAEYPWSLVASIKYDLHKSDLRSSLVGHVKKISPRCDSKCITACSHTPVYGYMQVKSGAPPTNPDVKHHISLIFSFHRVEMNTASYTHQVKL